MIRKIMLLFSMILVLCLFNATAGNASILVQWKADSNTLDTYQSVDGGTVSLNGAEFASGIDGNGMDVQSGDTPFFTATHGNNIDLDKGSISFWYKNTDPVANYGTFFQAGETYDKFSLYRSYKDNIILFRYNFNFYSYNINPSVNVFDGEWHHIRIAWDRSITTAAFYVDGILEGNKTITSSLPILSGSNFYVGNRNDGNNSSGGIIDEFYISSDPSFYGSSLPGDIDGDGLSDAFENTICTNPNDWDTDDDGIPDGVEERNGNGDVDVGETDPCNIDTDGDGIQDGTEIGYIIFNVGQDTDTGVFQEDLDPTTVTDPKNTDTDGDSINDGDEDTNHNGLVDAGETDPNEGLDDRILVYWKADSNLLDLYRSQDGRYVSLNGAEFASGIDGNGMDVQSGDTPFFTATHGNNIDLDKGSISFWYKNTGPVNRVGMFFMAEGDFSLFGNVITDAIVFYYGRSHRIFPSVNVFDGEWHHIRIAWDRFIKTVSFYVDGILESNMDMTRRARRPTLFGSNFYVGSSSNGSYSSGGIIDEFYISSDPFFNPLNDFPVISDISDQSINEDNDTGNISFTVDDVETPLASLVVTATSDNQTLVPDANITLGGSDGNRTILVDPVDNGYGTATITVTVTDGDTGTAIDTFVLTVNSDNDLPTISDITDQNITEDDDTGNIAFTIGDIETPLASLVVTATSDNQTLVPDANITLGGSDGNRTILVDPVDDENGTATITVTVTDGDTASASDTFVVTVSSQNDTPTISDITDQTINEDADTGNIAFTVDDVETPLDSLVLTVTSDNQTLVPDANITLGGNDGNRTILVDPVDNGFGSATITVTVTDSDTGSATDTFILTVTSGNDLPTISDISNQTINEDDDTGNIAFTIDDVETPLASLIVAATSDNQTLVPDANITLGGTEGNRTILVDPVDNGFGTATITVMVTDGDTASTSDTFLVTVSSQNDPPTISDISNQTISEDDDTGNIAFTVDDIETPLGSLVVTATSDNQTLVPDANITLGGSDGNRTILVDPVDNGFGTANITVTVTDGDTDSISDTFVVMVNSQNDSPTISDISDQTINEDSDTGNIAFTVDDVETPLGSLVVTATSDNQTLVPDANITLGGSDGNRTILVDPVSNGYGTATITVTVTDGDTAIATDTFLVTVTSDNDLPTISDISDQTINEDTDTGNIAFTVDDVETPLGSLVVTAASDNQTLVPDANITLGGTEGNRTILVDPVDNEFGSATITVTVTDGDTASASDTFVLTVISQNDPPVANDDTATTIQETPVTIDVLANDTDPENDTLFISGVTQPANGAVVVNGDNTFTYTPSAGFSGTDTFTYTAGDGNGGFDTATVTVEVTVLAPPENIDFGFGVDEQQGGGGLVGESIRLLTGNVAKYRADLTLPSPNSLGLSFGAFYNSRSDRIGPLGYGWMHTYEAFLDPNYEISGITFIKILDQTGRAHYFQEDTPGDYIGSFSEQSEVKEEAGEYVWYRLSGVKYGFSASGWLQWLEDHKGNRITVSYDAQDRIDTITDTASGRSITLIYNAYNRVFSITGPVTTAVSDGLWVKNYTYDANGNLTNVTYADNSGFTYEYTDTNDVHNLTMKKDIANHTLNTWSYDTQDRVDNSFTVGGKGVTIQYVSDTQVNVTDAYGTLRSYTVTDINGQKRVTNMSGIGNTPYSGNNNIRWAYDTNLNLVETETARGRIDQYQNFDSKGSPGTVILAQGASIERTITYTYHPNMNVPLTRIEQSVLGGGNKVTIWDYDNDSNTIPNESPTKLLYRIKERGFTKDATGAIVPYEYATQIVYNAEGQVTDIDGPRAGTGDTTLFTYDPAAGNLLTINRSLVGNTILSRYDGAGRPGTITDVNSQSKTFVYDGRGRVRTITNNADGSFTDIVYNTSGKPGSITDPDSITRTFDYYNDYGRLETITDPEGNYIQYQYDTRGNRIEMGKYDSLDNRTSRKRWDFQHPDYPGRLYMTINANDSYTKYDYDADGNIAAVTDPEFHMTSYDYDSLNRLSTVTQPGDISTTYGYDGHGNLSEVTDAENHNTSYTYDDMGRLVQTASPDTGSITYLYDEAGNLLSKTDAKGIIITYAYDNLNRLDLVDYPADPDVDYIYDAGTNGIGRLTSITDASGSLSFGYDNRGRLTSRGSISEGVSYSFGQTFTPGGKVDTVTYPSGRTFDYTRDAMGRMEGLTTTYNSNTVALAENMTYNPFGGPKGMSTGAGGEVENQSGECDCVEVVNPGSMMERSYSYDDNRNLLAINAPNTPWYNQTFTYDELNRLTSTEGRYGSRFYTYDDVGNRLTRTVNSETENYTYVPNTNKLNDITDLDPIAFAHDLNGNMTTHGTKTLIYNQNNRLIRVEENSTPLGEYAYNALGQRVTKDVDGNVTVFHYDADGNLIAEGLPDGTITKEYLYMGSIRMAMVDVNTQEFYYYLNDRLGTPQLITDNAGTVVWEAIYNPYGEAQVHPQANVVNNLRFPGQYFDQETGFHYNYHRYYDPRTGRYLRADPIGLLGGINLYPYVLNNPVNNTDPEGLHGVILGARPFFHIPRFIRGPNPRYVPRPIPKSTPKPKLRPVFRPPPRIIKPQPKPWWYWILRLLKPTGDIVDPYLDIYPVIPKLESSPDPCEEKEEPKSFPPKGIPPEWVT